ncbi:MAG TPA: sulfotransferase [Terriglobales bacterium]|nr:sulfotransferase [Terriglobales bacterium]
MSTVAQLGSTNAGSGTSSRAKAPVFVIGSPRSGTTLLYHMILSAGNFAVYRTESHVFTMIAARYGDLSVQKNREQMVDQWLKSKYFRLTGLDAQTIRAQIVSECRSGGDFLRIVMENMARAQHVERWAENTPEHILYLKEIKRTIPNALFVHIIRDGRDVALSLDKQGWVKPFPWHKDAGPLVCGIYWEWIVEAGRKVGPSFGADYMELHYEDLIVNPRETLSRIGQFIQHDLDYDRILEVGIGSVREPNTSFDAASGQPFNPVGRWKKSYTPEMLAKLEGMIGGFLKAADYELATPESDIPDTVALKNMRAMYRTYFASRLWAKSHVPLANRLVDISWMQE